MILLVLSGKMIFIFPGNLIVLPGRKTKDGLSQKTKYMEIWYFLQMFWKDGLFKNGIWSFLYYLKRWYFFPENIIFFLWTENERWSFSRNTRTHDIFFIYVQVPQKRHRASLPKKSKTILSHKNTPKGDWYSRLIS